MRLTVAALALLALPAAIATSLDERLSSKIVEYPCVRVVGVDQDVGCRTTDPRGVGGSLVLVDSEDALRLFEDLNKRPSRIAVLTPGMVTAAVIDRLEACQAFVGAISLPANVSDVQSPAPLNSRQFAGDRSASAVAWNPAGQALTNRKFDWPWTAVTGEAAVSLLERTQANRARSLYRRFPQWSARLYYEMGPDSLRTEQCLADGSCLPLGGQSVWAATRLLNTSAAGESPVLAGGAMDANSLFHDLAKGGNRAVATVALVAGIASALGASDAAELPLPIVLGLFQGETWGRLGSRRWVHELESFDCEAELAAADSPTDLPLCTHPMRPSLEFRNLTGPSAWRSAVALEQLGMLSGGRAWLHRRAPADAGPHDELTAAIFERVAAKDPSEALAVSVEEADAGSSRQLPPSSFDPALELDAAASVTVLAGFPASGYVDSHFGSQFDTAERLEPTQLTRVATLAARALYALATGDDNATSAVDSVPPAVVADEAIVAGVVDCLSATPNCRLMSNLTAVAGVRAAAIAGPEGFSFYPNVYTPPFVSGGNLVLQPTLVELFVRNLLSDLLVTPERVAPNVTCRTSSDCAGANNSGLLTPECIQQRCIRPTSHYHPALSVNLGEGSGYGQYAVKAVPSVAFSSDPVWAEPYWSVDIGAHVYLVDQPANGPVMLVTGLLLTAGAVIGVGRFNKRVLAHFRIAGSE